MYKKSERQDYRLDENLTETPMTDSKRRGWYTKEMFAPALRTKNLSLKNLKQIAVDVWIFYFLNGV